MNNKIRVLIISLIMAMVTSLMFLVVPITTNFIIGYIFSIIAIAGLALSVLMLTKKNTKIPQDFAFPLVARTYLILSIIVTIIVVALEAFNVWSMPFIIFLIIHIALLAIFTIRIIMLLAGKEHIDAVDKKVAEKTLDLRVMLADLDDIKEKTTNLPSPDKEKAEVELKTIYEALKYSDPMSSTSLVEYENKIKESMIMLENAVGEKDLAKIEHLSVQIQRQIKDRNNRVKLMK